MKQNMKLYEFTKTEALTVKQIRSKNYMQKTVALVDDYIKNSSDKSTACKSVFDDVYNILYQAKSYVDKLLDKRKKLGEISDIKQSLKSIAGNSFSQILVYIFLLNKQYGNIRPEIFITTKTAKIPSFKDSITINVDGETQKPDCDIVIYSLQKDGSLNQCMILSLKTSLRERAGQTYKWKLLMEIANTSSEIKEKYNISYNPTVQPIVCFATVNFYNEINNPQQRGMFKFFDKSFIAKHVNANFITRLSELPNFVNENL